MRKLSEFHPNRIMMQNSLAMMLKKLMNCQNRVDVEKLSVNEESVKIVSFMFIMKHLAPSEALSAKLEGYNPNISRLIFPPGP